MTSPRPPGAAGGVGAPADRLAADGLRDKARTVGWGLAWYGAVSFAGAFLVQHAMAASGVQAALAEWAASRLGVTWSDAEPRAGVTDAEATRATAMHAAWGFAAGLGAAALVIAVAVAAGVAKIGAGRLAVTSLAVGLLDAAFVAVRDELFLRGLVLRVVGDSARSIALGACALASAASALGAHPEGITAPALVATSLGGVAFGALWIRDRGAWRPVCAHAAWLWATSSLAHGALVDVRAVDTPWGGGAAGVESGWAGAAAVGALAALAVWAAGRRRAP